MRAALLLIVVCLFGTAYGAVDNSLLREPLTLEHAEDLALAHNRAILALKQIAKQGQYRKFQAKAQWRPSVSVSGEMMRTDQGFNMGYGTFYSSVLAFRQSIFDASVYQGIKLSKIEEKQLKSDLDVLKNEVLYQIRSGFYQTVQAQNQVDVQKENVEVLQEALSREEYRLSVGVNTRFDVDESRVAVANAWTAYYQAVKDYRVAQNTLRQLLGLDPGHPLTLATREIPVQSIEEVVRKLKRVKSRGPGEELFDSDEVLVWEDHALHYRPEVRRQELSLALAEQTERSKSWEYAPSFQAFANYYNRDSGGISFLSRNSYWDMGVDISWQLFDGMGRENRVREAKAGRRAAAIELAELRQQTQLDIRNRLYEVEEGLLSYVASKESMGLAEEALELARVRRDVGAITPLEYRDAVSALTQARQGFYEASFRLLDAYYALRQIGGFDVGVS